MKGQNVYDDEVFFAAYQHLRDNGAGLNEALEQPALRAMLPDITAADVVDLGCGDGALSRSLARAGARSVLGVDPSARMLELATSRTEDTRVRYQEQFAEDLQLPPESVDLVVSSLALHYVPDLPVLVRRVASWLRPGGVLLASMEHPLVTAAPGGARQDGWLVSDYADEGMRHTRWFVDDVHKHHRTVASTVTAVLDAGLVLTGLDEPAPPAGLLEQRPDLAIHRHRPALLLIRAQRPPA